MSAKSPLSPSRSRFAALIIAVTACLPSAAFAVPSAAREWNEQILGAIRRNVPNPPGHARNLFHTAVAMYDAWTAYDPTAVGYIYNEKVSQLPADVEAARREAVSYAAYRVLRSRFATGPGAAVSLASFDAKLTEMGYSPAVGQSLPIAAATPAELGKRIGQAILNWGAGDGFALTSYPQPYTNTPALTVNPNLSVPLDVMGTNGNFQDNMPLGYGIPFNTSPNHWQPLALASSVTQNGIPIPGGVQTFVGVQGLATTAFSLTRADATKPWIDTFGGPSRLSTPGNPSSTDAAYKEGAMDVLRKSAKLNDSNLVDISPRATGNNPIGTDNGSGFPRNPLMMASLVSNNPKRMLDEPALNARMKFLPNVALLKFVPVTISVSLQGVMTRLRLSSHTITCAFGGAASEYTHVGARPTQGHEAPGQVSGATAFSWKPSRPSSTSRAETPI